MSNQSSSRKPTIPEGMSYELGRDMITLRFKGSSGEQMLRFIQAICDVDVNYLKPKPERSMTASEEEFFADRVKGIPQHLWKDIDKYGYWRGRIAFIFYSLLKEAEEDLWVNRHEGGAT